MRPIFTVTPNPSVDRIALVPGFEAGHVYRAETVRTATGGKGVNVSRSLAGCGRATLAFGLLGGHTGRLSADLAVRDALPAHWTWTQAETRTCVVVVGDDGRHATVINEEGPPLPVDDWQRFAGMVAGMVEPGDFIGLCGSVPAGIPPEAIGDLSRALVAAGARVFVDMTEPVLAAAAAAGPEAIKINAEEAGAFLGRSVPPADAPAAARAIGQRTGVPLVVITLGAHGAVLSAEGRLWRAVPPQVRAVSAIGSGDAFLAGLLMALQDGLAMDAALARAVAAGTANALCFGGGEVSPESLARLEETVAVQALAGG